MTASGRLCAETACGAAGGRLLNVGVEKFVAGDDLALSQWCGAALEVLGVVDGDWFDALLGWQLEFEHLGIEA
jgi:hypothetical protein